MRPGTDDYDLGCGFGGVFGFIRFSDTSGLAPWRARYMLCPSSLFTALVFCLILKWEEARRSSDADVDRADRLYLMGLSSIGVHLLNLLCIPAIVLVYYYKKFPESYDEGYADRFIGVVRYRGLDDVWCRTRLG